MNCHDTESLLFAERDGTLHESQRASLAAHVAGCASCRAMQQELAQAASAWRSADASVATPAVETEWHAIRRRIRHEVPVAGGAARGVVHRRPWPFALGAVAALVLFAAVFGTRWFRTDMHAPLAGSDYVSYVVVHNATDSTMVYEDRESGWLLVWVGDTAETSGS
jgi:hypothetical protein